MTEIAERLDTVRTIIGRTAELAGRKPEDVRLIAVSKGHDASVVAAALAAGQLIYGENRVQEAQKKFLPLRQKCPNLELHLIGALQTNKCDDAVALFDVIHTLDRPKLAKALATSIKKIGRQPKLYVEVNIGREPQKAGITAASLADFLFYCRTDLGLNVEGLMCIPPQTDDPVTSFTALSKLAEQNNLSKLSMGMSGDFEQAIGCGATYVRIGTAIFGERSENRTEN